MLQKTIIRKVMKTQFIISYEKRINEIYFEHEIK